MTTKSIVLALITIGILGGGVWYLKSGVPAEPARETSVTDTTERSAEAEDTGTFTEVSNLRELMMRGADLVCAFSSTDADGTTNAGTVYISNERFRVDATTLANGQEFESSMIYDRETVYSWTDGPDGQFAFMFEIPPEEMMNEVSSPSEDFAPQGNVVSVQEEATYECEPWAAREERFVPPEDIEFMNMAESFGEGFPQQ